jgi:hypothetical protein
MAVITPLWNAVAWDNPALAVVSTPRRTLIRRYLWAVHAFSPGLFSSV